MNLRPSQRLRIEAQRLYHRVHGQIWFPHLPLAVLLGIGALWLLLEGSGESWRPYVEEILSGRSRFPVRALPDLLLGLGMLTMAVGLVMRSRLAWTMAVMLTAGATVSVLLGDEHNGHLLVGYFLLILIGLLVAWRQFDRSSVAASTLFAVTSVVMLLFYATFGTYYLGNEFKPPVTDLVSALYYSIVSMSTVGYGDITPRTDEAKLFAVSIIVLGVTVFATSLTAVIVPVVGRGLRGVINRKGKPMKRENHFVVIGATPLAVNTWRELTRRGQPVTRICRQPPVGDAQEADLVVGDPSSEEILKKAGADKAQAVLAMLDDDSENAFVVLAVRELKAGVKTVVAVNDSQHLSRLRLVQPDVVIAPQILGGELAAMMMCGEQITSDFILNRMLQHDLS